MAITRLFKCKDFTTRAYRGFNPMTRRRCFLYKVVYLGEDGRLAHEIERGFLSKDDARKYISGKVKKANAVLKKANAVGRVSLLG